MVTETEDTPTSREKIDMVISWAGPDSAERAQLRAEYNLKVQRYRDNGELEILLQSIDQFGQDIIRFIHIILPDSAGVPDWLAMNPRVKLVRESQVLEHLPTFNSHAIEAVMDRIPDLTPYFFYSCDDHLFTAPVLWKNWFDEQGRYVVPKGDQIPNRFELRPGVHYKAWMNNRKLLKKVWPKHQTQRPAHMIVVLSKEGFSRARELFPEAFEATSKSTLRSKKNIHPVGLVLNVDLVEQRACLKKVPTFFFAVFDFFLTNRVLRNFNLHKIRSAQMASVNDNGGAEKHRNWVRRNIYNCLLRNNTSPRFTKQVPGSQDKTSGARHRDVVTGGFRKSEGNMGTLIGD
jgi:hypothetical protein